MNASITLSAADRSKVRKALTSHPAWKAAKADKGWAIESMGASQLLSACYHLGIDVPAVIANGHDEGGEHMHKPRPHSAAAVDALEARFREVSTSVSDKARFFCQDVFLTVRTKQDGCATENQFRAIERIVVRAEAGQAEDAEAPKVEAPKANGHANGASLIPANHGDAATQLASLIGQLAGQSINPEQVARIVDERINAALAGIPAVRIEIAHEHKTIELDGHHHPKFPLLLKAAASRMANGVAPAIWLAGPAGSGKTHGAHMVAKALDLPWHYNGALSMPHELLGFIDAGGTYHRTPFREAYEHGGVYLFDEVDASDNSALLALNAALANGVATFPDGQVARHKDCIIIATANTWGLGATADYVGRSKIDAAFLSRFPVRIAWDYDSALEVAVSGHENFARRVIAARERARTAGIKVMIDPRASQAGAALIAAGLSQDEAAELTYLANLTPEQRKTVEGR